MVETKVRTRELFNRGGGYLTFIHYEHGSSPSLVKSILAGVLYISVVYCISEQPESHIGLHLLALEEGLSFRWWRKPSGGGLIEISSLMLRNSKHYGPPLNEVVDRMEEKALKLRSKIK